MEGRRFVFRQAAGNGKMGKAEKRGKYANALGTFRIPVKCFFHDFFQHEVLSLEDWWWSGNSILVRRLAKYSG